MTKKKSAQASRNQSNFGGNASYADVSLQQADKDAFSNWMAGVQDDFPAVFLSLIDDSYRVTSKFDYNNSCYACTLTQQDDKHVNANLIIISRSDDPIEAFWLNVYKVYVLFDGERLPTRDDNLAWG